MFLTLLEAIAIFYLVELSFYSYAAFRARQISRSKTGSAHNNWMDHQPKISVVVAAKDEEDHLQACIDSLLQLIYPHELLEIVIVNDQSSDSTPSIIDAAKTNFIGMKRVDSIESDILRGKANALSQGIDYATGEFIFLTDADCLVPPSWITETLKYFDEDTGIVGGVTLISKTDRTIYGIQAMDWDLLLTFGAGAATLGKPVGCLGNNLVFRKKAYDEIGGYRKIKFSVTEDFALFKAIASSKAWSYRFPMDELTLVETLPLESLEEIFSQRKRWGTGGKDTGIFGFLTLAPGFLFHWLIILSPFLSLPIGALFFFAKLLMDTLFVIPTLRHYGKIAHLKFMLYFEIYYLIYVAILPFSVYFGKAVTWKGREY
ncbi:MAG: glycosyltransferase [Candidatus Kryptoniota bacterium]